MTIDKTTNPALYEARKHYWALQQNVIQATDTTSALSPAEGQLIADDGADSVNATEYASLYKSENMSLSVGGLPVGQIALVVIVLILIYLGYKKYVKKQKIVVRKGTTKIPVT